MKTAQQYYGEIKLVLENNNHFLLNEFEKKIKLYEPKEVFLWLEEKSRNKELPEEIEPILTEFFYSIH